MKSYIEALLISCKKGCYKGIKMNNNLVKGCIKAVLTSLNIRTKTFMIALNKCKLFVSMSCFKQ